MLFGIIVPSCKKNAMNVNLVGSVTYEMRLNENVKCIDNDH